MTTNQTRRRPVRQTLEQIETQVSALRAQVTEQLTTLMERVSDPRPAARGTQEMDPVVREPAPVRDAVEARLANLLRHSPQGTLEAARALQAPASRVQRALDALRKAGRIYNIGTADHPVWQAVLGDEAPTPDHLDVLKRVLRQRPFLHSELVDLTGARPDRVSGFIVLLQRYGEPIVNVGNRRRARWFLVPPDAARRLRK